MLNYFVFQILHFDQNISYNQFSTLFTIRSITILAYSGETCAGSHHYQYDQHERRQPLGIKIVDVRFLTVYMNRGLTV